jgi:sulfhydrogenase subunit delta
MARKKEVKRATAKKKPTVGIFSFTCCEGCQFTILFIDGILDLMAQADFQYFHLLKEKNRKAKFDLAIVEGAITTEREVRKLKEIRKKSKYLIAIGACACNGGIPSMRNFIEREKL